MTAKDRSGPDRAAGSPSGVPPRPSPAVYRRRRIVAAALALVLLAAIAAGGYVAVTMIGSALADGGNEKPEASAAGTAASGAETGGTSPQSDSPSEGAAEPSSGMETTDADPCRNAVTISAATNQRAFGPEEDPVLSLEVHNDGESDCLVNLGTSQMEFLITSGSDRIFSSRDCQVDAGDNYQTLEPGQTETANFVWERNRTAPACDAVGVNPKPGTYVLITKLGERTSGKAVFELN